MRLGQGLADLPLPVFSTLTLTLKGTTPQTAALHELWALYIISVCSRLFPPQPNQEQLGYQCRDDDTDRHKEQGKTSEIHW